MAIPKGPKKKKPVARRISNKNNEPSFEGALELDGPTFGRLKNSANDYYRMEFKSSDYKLWVKQWMLDNSKWKDKATVVQKLPDSCFGPTVGGLCRMLSNGMPDVHPAYNEHWISLAGTMGTVKPFSEFVEKTLKDLYERGSLVVEETKKKQEEESTVYKPTIQERIYEQSVSMSEKIDIWLEKWMDEMEKFNPREFDISKHLRDSQCTQAHARKIRDFYIGEIEELDGVVNFPSKAELAKMSEYDQETYAQYKEAYAIYSTKALKRKLDSLKLLMGSLDVIIQTAKATRKPRKRVLSKEKMVTKLKYAHTDDRFKLASINPQDIIFASELWVFNIKTRKLGRYIAQNLDPMRQGREGSGLSIKGTTIINFNESLSVQKTLRKPEEKLEEFKQAGSRKVKTFLDEINAVDIKLNGRINPDTILLKVVQ
jgi:hypothetical protein